jgi:transcription initiation factor TFIIIB Brf1 subunit/transcription initiation factor TFIIB
MRAAGFGTWLVAVLPSTMAFVRADLVGLRALGFAIAAIAFLAAFVVGCCMPSSRRNAALATSNREIADALGAAEGTVKNHASSILSKLGVRDRTRAVLTAIERGLI